MDHTYFILLPGVSFEVALPANSKPQTPQKESSPTYSYSSDADSKLENTSNKGRSALETELAYVYSDDESKSPHASPKILEAVESLSQKYSDDHFRNSFEADAETQRTLIMKSTGRSISLIPMIQVSVLREQVLHAQMSSKRMIQVSVLREQVLHAQMSSKRAAYLPSRIQFPEVHCLWLAFLHTMLEQAIPSSTVCLDMIPSVRVTVYLHPNGRHSRAWTAQKAPGDLIIAGSSLLTTQIRLVLPLHLRYLLRAKVPKRVPEAGTLSNPCSIICSKYMMA